MISLFDRRRRRSSQKHLNAAAHTPEFKPGAYKAPKLSDDALHLLADFIRRPAIRNQLIPLVGELPDRKRRKTKAEKKEVKIVVSEETGRRLKTRLSAQQTASLEERYKEKAQWRPTECEKLLEGLNALGPELSTEQVSRWFDNKRRYVKKQQARARDSATADEGNDEVHAEEKRKTKVERRVRHSEREMLEAAFAQNSAPGISVRTALATAIGISEKQVTAWFTRRQQTGRAPYGVSASVEDVENRSSKRANTAGSDAVIAGHLLGSLGASGHPLMMQQQGDFNPELNPGVLSALGVPVGGDGRAQAGNGLTGVWGW